MTKLVFALDLSSFTDAIFETGASGVPSKSQKSFICGGVGGGWGDAPLPGGLQGDSLSHPIANEGVLWFTWDSGCTSFKNSIC